MRRSQILLASADRVAPAEIGRIVGCTAQAVRNAIRAFEDDGLRSTSRGCAGSWRPRASGCSC
ncbi:MAG: helix-turn-helix domain-containing protein [Gemmataceae bacterium]|nr:helix-turn-helix domain-containing protein [Gemmataceae bacterium]